MKFTFFRRARKRDERGEEEKKNNTGAEEEESRRLTAYGRGNANSRSSIGRGGKNSDVVIPKGTAANGEKAKQSSKKMEISEREFFTEYGEAGRYKLHEIIGKGSYGVVCSATDTQTGEKVAIKRINDVFDHVSDAVRILREVKLLRLLKHPDIVQIKHILLPHSKKSYKDIYVIFELLETDLHQVIKANDDLSDDHYQYFLYQLLRALKYMHTAHVFHRDLKPKNILANSDCKLKICDFGLARVAFSEQPQAIYWTDYVATRWYRAPELCGSFFTKYTPAIDIWGVGCIFAELLLGKPLFPGKNVVHQLELITDLLGTPPEEDIMKVRNEKARRYLLTMKRKPGIPFDNRFPKAKSEALSLLKKMLDFDPQKRPSAEECLRDPYFYSIARPDREPVAKPISKWEFDFERRRTTLEIVRELIYEEILEYHPTLKKEYKSGSKGASFNYPSAVDMFKQQFMQFEEGLLGPGQQKNGAKRPVTRDGGGTPRGADSGRRLRPSTSLPREKVNELVNGLHQVDLISDNAEDGDKNNQNNGGKSNALSGFGEEALLQRSDSTGFCPGDRERKQSEQDEIMVTE